MGLTIALRSLSHSLSTRLIGLSLVRSLFAKNTQRRIYALWTIETNNARGRNRVLRKKLGFASRSGQGTSLCGSVISVFAVFSVFSVFSEDKFFG